jgi:tRNA dimethylallyltransferase
MSSQLPLVVIVGPTASGKTGLGIKLAQQFNGEIISADSRAVYIGLDIGSAKPTLKERGSVPHWGFDLIQPGERFTAASFKEYANQKITEIRAQGHIPFLVGGTGLYVDSVIFDYEFPAEPAPADRNKWDKMSLVELHGYCAEHNIVLPQNKLNKRYVINTILHNGCALKRRNSLIENTIIVGITTDKVELRQRIAERTEQFLANGVLQEAEKLAHKYGWDNEAMTGNIYPLAREYFDGQITLGQLTELFNTKEWQLAKRQITWLKRNSYIEWLPVDKAYTYLTQSLAHLNNS